MTSPSSVCGGGHTHFGEPHTHTGQSHNRDRDGGADGQTRSAHARNASRGAEASQGRACWTFLPDATDHTSWGSEGTRGLSRRCVATRARRASVRAHMREGLRSYANGVTSWGCRGYAIFKVTQKLRKLRRWVGIGLAGIRKGDCLRKNRTGCRSWESSPSSRSTLDLAPLVWLEGNA